MEELAAKVSSGDRRALARAITLIESTRSDHRTQANELLDLLIQRSSATEIQSEHRRSNTMRIGITGAPGVGKSTLIGALGLHLVRAGLSVAVLSVDPSSSRTGGSILGDKTRMGDLIRSDRVFVRPTPSGGMLGGVGRRTAEAITLTEAAGFDVTIVETVGVGQSEIGVADMTDSFVLLVAPAGGDELQGVKRGIMELADVVVVNKCDGLLLQSGRATLADYTSALRLQRPNSPSWTPVAIEASAVEEAGIELLWSTLLERHTILTSNGELAHRRGAQRVKSLESEITEQLRVLFATNQELSERIAAARSAVEGATRSPASAAVDVIGRLASILPGGADH